MTPAARRVVCPTCIAGPGVPCRFGRSSVAYHHVSRKVAAGDAVLARATGKRPTISVSAAAYEQIKGEAKRRGLSVTKVVEQRIARLTGEEIAVERTSPIALPVAPAPVLKGGLVKISERDREEAIEACLLTAEWWTTGADTHPLSLTVVRVAVHDLGFEAIHAVESAMGGPESHEAGAVRALEAAALLRDGWNPGDPVEVRR